MDITDRATFHKIFNIKKGFKGSSEAIQVTLLYDLLWIEKKKKTIEHYVTMIGI